MPHAQRKRGHPPRPDPPRTEQILRARRGARGPHRVPEAGVAAAENLGGITDVADAGGQRRETGAGGHDAETPETEPGSAGKPHGMQRRSPETAASEPDPGQRAGGTVFEPDAAYLALGG